MTRSFRSFSIVADDLSGAADCAAAFARTSAPVRGRPSEDLRQSDLVKMLDAADLRPVLLGQPDNPTHLARGIETALEGGARTIDHGTAFDIAGTGRADAGSMVAALELAAEFSPRSSL